MRHLTGVFVVERSNAQPVSKLPSLLGVIGKNRRSFLSMDEELVDQRCHSVRIGFFSAQERTQALSLRFDVRVPTQSFPGTIDIEHSKGRCGFRYDDRFGTRKEGIPQSSRQMVVLSTLFGVCRRR